MRTRVVATMRNAYARRYAVERSLLDAQLLLQGISSARLISAPGYSMCISVEEREATALAHRLEPDFVVETGVLWIFAAARESQLLHYRGQR